ncbi:tripartite tricarboxylate transporter substrate binding protein [Roseomonas terrae]|jgi:tripartite-type tricarboxylate transporter receptor subunit TctC|uniref:Tripartite tricarboxylate transporter substrate binding protein n=1 Tax=Neoroseomonas terrae TaxID=424799 RepID=A0ABS5EGD6_9PROT|nr:tripartite tricarboxylate transporter substrate binding protein [Neoroseomonas terrae]MBR0650089.1 tripartite tricarboxylate transporter substrate binding protein [Neoroseomonas terrae]
MTESKISRRAALGSALAGTLARPAFAQAFPDRPVRIVVPFSAGGGTDIAAREIGRRMSETLGQPVVIENRSGANTAIGAEYVARSRPDGYTLLFTSGSTMLVAPLVTRNLSYKLSDFTPVGLVLDQYFGLGVPPRVAGDIPALVEKARARPDGVSFGHTGTGGVGHLLGEKLMVATGTRMVSVPYRGFQQTVTDILGGQLDMTFEGIHNIVPYHRDGTIKLLALASPERAPPLPDVPIFKDIGYPDLAVDAWLALFAPAATPAPIMEVLNRALVAAVDSPSFREHAASQVQNARSSSVQEMSDSLARQVEVWRGIIEPLNLQLD